MVGERIADVSIPAVKIAMDLCEVKNQKKCLEGVMRIFHNFIGDQEPHASGIVEPECDGSDV